MISLATLTEPAAPKKVLPFEITSLDLLKSLAVVLMVIDHLGEYLYPEMLWLRAIGRIGFPVWFFMAGYAAPRMIEPRLIIGGIILLVANYLAGQPLLPLNALFSILFVRLLIHPIMKPVEAGQISIWFVAAVLTVLIIFTTPYTQYGTMALITAIFGYLVRNRDKVIDQKIIVHYMIFSLTVFVLMQVIWFHFDWYQTAIVIIGTLMVRMQLLNLRMETYPALTAKLPAIARGALKLMGRRTLEIYVIHLLILKVIVVLLHIEPWKLALH